MDSRSTLICIPTYNELGNVEKILTDIFNHGFNGDILFIDDNSSDGTGDKIDELIKINNNVYCIHRSSKLGIGSAHQDGIKWAYDNNYDKLITMDCDFSHLPKYINDFIVTSENADIVVGTRFNNKKSLKSWNYFRRILTHTGHIFYKKLLKLDFDATGAFRLYNLKNIPKGIFSLIHGINYSFFFESLHILHLNNIIIQEVDIELPARTYGNSKMSYTNLYLSMFNLIYLLFKTRLNQHSLLYSESQNESVFEVSNSVYTSDGENSPAKVKEEWDEYWKVNTNRSNVFYELIAAFYRKYIIKRSMNFHLNKLFNSDSNLLHAGCGSGQVDEDITNNISVTGLDISSHALNIYKKVNPNSIDQIQGDIFAMPFENKKFDGIYNLGVMEHFTTKEIHLILNEFNRILDDNGKIVLFWPPEYGLSVMFLKVVHFIMRNIFNNHKMLHPDEITRIKSKKHIKKMLEKANFNLIKSHFGIRDLFTYNIVVANKALT